MGQDSSKSEDRSYSRSAYKSSASGRSSGTKKNAPVAQKEEKKIDTIKVLFLDVDGVLNCSKTSFAAATSNDVLGEKVTDYPIDIDKLENLKDIIIATKARVVISSTWRQIEQARRKLVMALRSKKIQVIGDTPSLDLKGDRTDEIRLWLKTYAKENKDEPVEMWVAVDDLPLADFDEDFMEGHFVQTSIQEGLTRDKMYECIALLNNLKQGATGAQK